MVHFVRQFLAFFSAAGPVIFLKSPIGCISSHNDVNSRVIKHFKGPRLIGLYFSCAISQSLARRNNCVREISQCTHYFMSEKLCSATFSWSVACHTIGTREEHLRTSTREANFNTKGAIESVRVNKVSVLSGSWYERRTGQLASSNQTSLTYTNRQSAWTVSTEALKISSFKHLLYRWLNERPFSVWCRHTFAQLFGWGQALASYTRKFTQHL